MRPVPARRLLLLAVLLLVAAALASTLAARDRTPAATAPAPPASAPVPTVTGRLPGATVRARVGDLVSVEVDATTTDTAQIVALGVQAPVEPDLPGQLEFLADQAGRFAVTLRDAGTRVGTVQVEPAA
jgi:hypothetical protein